MARIIAVACLVLAPCPVIRSTPQVPAPVGTVVTSSPPTPAVSTPRLVRAQTVAKKAKQANKVHPLRLPSLVSLHSHHPVRAVRLPVAHRKPSVFTDAPHKALTIADVPQPWKALAWCEGGRDLSYRVSSSSHFRGWFQFLPSSWRWMGGQGDPAAAPLTEQLMRARRLLKAQGWVAWPVCSRELGLR